MKKFTLYLSITFCFLFLLTGCIAAEKLRQISPNFLNSISAPLAKQKNGELISCSIFEGQASFSNGWFPINNTDFKINKNDNILVSIKKKSKKETADLRVNFDDKGQKMVFCPVNKNTEHISCSSLYALDDDYKTGIKRTFDVPKIIRGSTISCKY